MAAHIGGTQEVVAHLALQRPGGGVGSSGGRLRGVPRSNREIAAHLASQRSGGDVASSGDWLGTSKTIKIKTLEKSSGDSGASCFAPLLRGCVVFGWLAQEKVIRR